MSEPVSDHRPVMPGLTDYGFLAVDVYLPPDQRGQAGNGWSRYGDPGDNPGSGLKIQTYQNAEISDHIAFSVGGTDFGFSKDFFKDLKADAGFIGTPNDLPLQFREALRFVAQTLDDARRLDIENNTTITFSVTGHSLGGGEAQLISYVFGLGGMSLDAPGAQGLVNSPGFLQYIDQLRAEFLDVVPPASAFGVPESFINVLETGSLISTVDDAPVVQADTLTTDEGSAITVSASTLLANDSDVDGDTLTITAVSAADGEATLNADGTITYTPTGNANGTDTLTYTVSDGTETSTGTVNVTINAVNDAPDAVADNLTTNEDTAVTVDVTLVNYVTVSAIHRQPSEHLAYVQEAAAGVRNTHFDVMLRWAA